MATITARITVTLGSGLVREHEYELDNIPQLLVWTNFYAEQLKNVFALQTSNNSVVLEPFTVYNRDHIASVQVDTSGAKEAESKIAEVIPAQMGFQSPPSSSGTEVGER